MEIVIDTREKLPYAFHDCPTVTATLPSGDYSLVGFEDAVAVERKTMADFIQCLTFSRGRFFAELDRLRAYRSAAIVVEGRWSDLERGAYRSHVSPVAATMSAVSIMQEYRLPIFFAGDRASGQRFTLAFLRLFWKHEAKKMAQTGEKSGVEDKKSCL